MCAFQSVKSADNGIAGHGSHNDLVGTVGDFSMAIQDIQDLLSFPITCPKFHREFEGGDSVV